MPDSYKVFSTIYIFALLRKSKVYLKVFFWSFFSVLDSQDVDLDALLGDLCEMEQSLQEQIWKGSQPATKVSYEEYVSSLSSLPI